MSQAKTTTLITRPPIVAIMGHVDHGKTTLLDAIRHSRLTQAEAGGITQRIGAYQVVHHDHAITFIDTPGHAAFSKMRERGANITDIVILVVDGTEGIKPQTVESIKHIRAAGCPLIVATNKKDLDGFSSDMVKAQLTEHQIFCEGYGGQVPVVEIAALKNLGIDDLLDMIILLSEVEAITTDTKAPLKAVIIESGLDSRKGPTDSVIVKDGKLAIGQEVFVGTQPVKIRALFDDLGKSIKEAIPGQPVEIIGFKFVPPVGGVITETEVLPAAPIAVEPIPVTPTTDPEGKPKEEEEEGLHYNLILKADKEGTLEAIKASISPDIKIIDASVGPVLESDILMAQSTKAEIINFAVPVNTSAKHLADIEKVTITGFTIIYKLLEYLEEKVLKLMEPTIDEEVIGTAEIIALFEMKGDKIAGCKMKLGEIAKKHLLHLLRQDVIIANPKIKSIRRGKEEVPYIRGTAEFGITFTTFIDFKVGDVIKSYKKN